VLRKVKSPGPEESISTMRFASRCAALTYSVERESQLCDYERSRQLETNTVLAKAGT
jgi:hypothetical protein